MGGGYEQEIAMMERTCDDLNGRVPISLADDIGCAARSDVPVLIIGAPEAGREIACAIDRRSRRPNRSVDVIDCRTYGALGKVMGHASWRHTGPGAGAILLLQEVHALNRSEQAQFEGRLAEWRVARRNNGPRIMASSSAPLFDRVLDGTFDERLYYRLNVFHMIVR
jgi:DNA-binding NtrC family response regulator